MSVRLGSDAPSLVRQAPRRALQAQDRPSEVSGNLGAFASI